MAKYRSSPPPTPACYATVLPGLEPVARDELETELGAEIKKKSKGMVVFRLADVDRSLLQLRTTEDVFLLAWGTDQLTFRAQDLRSIERWTAKDVKWDRLLRIHHAVRQKPSGKPTYRLVAQMTGRHGYRRVDAQKALAKGLAGKLPASWKPAEENAAVEIWLMIDRRTAVCGLRLSDRTMRHRTYKRAHIPASLRPTMAAAMIRLAETRAGDTMLDPMCGAGTILAEQAEALRTNGWEAKHILGGDKEMEALRSAQANLRHFHEVSLLRWDAARLPLASHSVDRVISNPPFGKQLEQEGDLRTFYQRVIREYHRVLRPDGRVVLLVSDFAAVKTAAKNRGWRLKRHLPVRVLGQAAAIGVWSVGGGS